MKPLSLGTILVCLTLCHISVVAESSDSIPALSDKSELPEDAAADNVPKTPPIVPMARARFYHRYPSVHNSPIRIQSVQKSPIRIPSVQKSPIRIPSVSNSPLRIPGVPNSPFRVPSVPNSPLRIPSAVKSPMLVPTAIHKPIRVKIVEKPPVRVPTVVKSPVVVPTDVNPVMEPRQRNPTNVKSPLPFPTDRTAPLTRDEEVARPVSALEEMLLRRQEWTEAGDKLPENHPYLQDVVHDVSVGETGITALRDDGLQACFINHYISPFLIPTAQRAFYTHQMPATVADSDDEIEEFRSYVGPIVAQHCQHVKSYWLDLDMFHKYSSGDYQSQLNVDSPVDQTLS